MDEPHQADPNDNAAGGDASRPETGSDAPALRVDVLLDPAIHFAAMHNDVPAVKRLTLTNAGETDAHDLELRLWVDRDLSAVWSHRLDRLPAGGSVVLEDIDLPLSAQTLAHITERDSADLHAQVRAGEALLLEQVWPVDALAFDEWAGIHALPELLAAFVVPNHPAIERLLGDARLHLERLTGDAALSGYQRRDPARARATTQAIYHAVGDLAIGYINPPASFEESGQRVRLPDQVLERRLGTCLDLTLLIAAMLEQAGLNPLIVLTRGHAFVGVWLDDERFPEPAVTEPLRLRKRVQLDEILVFETTGVTHSPTLGFDQACTEANKRLADPADFHYAVDVRTARARRIRPLPLRVKPGTYDLIDLERAAGETEPARHHDELDPPPQTLPAQPAPPTEPSNDDLAIDLADDRATAERLERWKRKLLDLSLRNRVLNHRDTKKSIPLEVPDPAGFEDRFARGEKFEVCPRAELMEGPDPRSAELHGQRTGEDGRTGYLRSEIADGRLHADLTERELDKRLVEVYRAARLGLEESGANTLYLAFGFLSWFETPTSTKQRLAPILLVPATLERLPAGRGYRLSALDEDPRVNVTLLEKLRTEYNLDTDGLETLDEDDAGLDVSAILRRFREAVRDIPRWDVVERVDLGLFSFNKFLMWRDLQDRSDALIANPVVQRLVDPSTATPASETALPDPAELDTTRRPHETLCPMDADSSQLAAIFAADDGHSFVLEGPPGTGKSQTITNLIAQALSAGKRVLFVSEKMAALSVVQRRLDKIGLGPFCLELHSNKANKRAVLDQLGESIDLPAQPPPEGWTQHAEDLHDVRVALNTLVEALHRGHAIGLSVYQATAELVALRGVPHIELPLGTIDALDHARLDAMLRAADRLTAAAHAVGPIEDHAYRACGLSAYHSALPGELLAAIAAAEESLEHVGECLGALLQTLGFTDITAAELSADATGWLVGLCLLLREAPVPTAALLDVGDFAAARLAITEQAELGRQRDTERSALLERYQPRVFDDDLAKLRDTLAEGMTALPILSWFKCYGPRKRLKLALQPGAALPRGAALLDELDSLIRVRGWTEALTDEANPARPYLGELWRQGEADWDAVLALVDWVERYRQHVEQPAACELATGPGLDAHASRLAIDERLALRGQAAEDQRSALGSALDRLADRLGAFDPLVSPDHERAWGTDDEPGRLDTIATTLESWRSDPTQLRDWAHWCGVRGEASALGLQPIIDAHAARVAPANTFVPLVRKAVLTQWHAAVIRDDPALAGFHRLDHERQIDRFRALDARFLSLTAEQVRATLSSRLPLHAEDPNDNSEVGVLRRQMKLKRRHMPVRKLIASLPNLLPRLKPCLLMSPLSVAQYLDAQSEQGAGPPFDLVVFDEASQIPVWDAVGALARGTSCVVVGDSKQLPPTNFFQKLESDDEVPDENDFVELESILDECSASGLPSMRLLWHYRSRHESLIAFSNAHYYDNRLNTFPSPADESEALGVTLRPIDGVYDRGATCTNPIEAEALVNDVVDRLKQYDNDTYRSIGIVTFSMAQQVLIEDLLDRARRNDPSLEVFFSDAVDEPVFVKNLENVQGDERAAIYFSVCYGPDSSGRVAMNFGPLNREGGERRLNVAVTRARERVSLYSSLRADQIDLTRTQAVGVRHLRAFIDYAERGAAAITAEQARAARFNPTPIDQALAGALRERGHHVDLHAGLSGYRVTLAVRDPDQPGAYLLGIELDGPCYRSAAAARDRDRTRPAVMRGLGWRLHRLWSLDYLHDPDAELDRIEDAIGRARRGETAQQIDTPAYASASTTRGKPRRRTGLGESVYEPYLPSKPEGDAEAFYNDAKAARVCRSVLKIAKREAPLHQSVLAKRLTLCWQIGRLTAKAADRAAQMIDRCVADGSVKRDGPFVWLAEQDPTDWSVYRVPADGDDTARDIDEVPPQELEAAAVAVLRRQIAIPRDELLRETAEVFGLSRVTPRVQPVIDDAVQALLDAGRCVIDPAGKVALP